LKWRRSPSGEFKSAGWGVGSRVCGRVRGEEYVIRGDVRAVGGVVGSAGSMARPTTAPSAGEADGERSTGSTDKIGAAGKNAVVICSRVGSTRRVGAGTEKSPVADDGTIS
jgi:hypothetical protein